MGSPYCTRSDVLSILSQDAEARLTTDPNVPVSVGIGNAVKTEFDLPFIGATRLVVLMDVPGDPNPVIGTMTLVPGGGTAGVDLLRFTTPPANGAIIAAKADQSAVNVLVVDQAIADACDELDSYLVPVLAGLGYRPPFSAGVMTALTAVLRPKAVFLVKWLLRRRRDMQDWDPMVVQYRQLYTWLTSIAKGDIALPVSTVLVGTTPFAGASWGGEDSVFGPPYSTGRTVS